MEHKSLNNYKKPKVTTYQIFVNGTLAKNWADWFNGILVNFEHGHDNDPYTVLTCEVRDQAELNGILNWLHNMNLALLKVQKIETNH